jgi:hypothetical protein
MAVSATCRPGTGRSGAPELASATSGKAVAVDVADSDSVGGALPVPDSHIHERSSRAIVEEHGMQALRGAEQDVRAAIVVHVCVMAYGVLR